MLERIEEIRGEADGGDRGAPRAPPSWRSCGSATSGRKAELTAILRGIAELPPEERGTVGGAANRRARRWRRCSRRAPPQLDAAELEQRLADDRVDVTLPGAPPRPVGHLHLITRTTRQIEDVMVGLGYRVIEGPEIEHDYYNFTALNHPPGHPARMLQDTFYVQSHPERAAAHPHLAGAGARDGGAAAADLHHRPGQGLPARLRRHPQPDVPPGRGARDRRGHHARRPAGNAAGDAAGDLRRRARGAHAAPLLPLHRAQRRVRRLLLPVRRRRRRSQAASAATSARARAGSRSAAPAWSTPTCSASSRRNGYDPERVQGFAFGMGVERIAMLRHGVPDLRRFFDNDVRVLEQFSMRVPYSWLREYCDPGIGAAELAERLAMTGTEVERVTPSARPPPTASSSAGCSSAEPHPNADRLRVCTRRHRRRRADDRLRRPQRRRRPDRRRGAARRAVCRAARSWARRSCAASSRKG